MKCLESIILMCARKMNSAEELFLVDSVFVFYLLDIFSWPFAFNEDKMMELLSFLRTEVAKSNGGSTTRVQNYVEAEFDIVLGVYEAKCLLRYVRLCGSNEQCLLLPQPEESSKKRWCYEIDRLALQKIFVAQNKNPASIRKLDIREYRFQVRRRRKSPTCNVRLLNRKKPILNPPQFSQFLPDEVYDFASPPPTQTQNEDSRDILTLKTQSVIDSINKLNYLSDSTDDFSCCSARSPSSDADCKMEDEEKMSSGLEVERTRTNVDAFFELEDDQAK